MTDFVDGTDIDVLNFDDVLGFSAGAGHPDDDAPVDMPDGSWYFRSNSTAFTKVLGNWQQELPAAGGNSGGGNLPFLPAGGGQLCLPTNNGFLPFILSSGAGINLPLSC